MEATKFTEVGYVGRDVESIIRDLVDIAVLLVKSTLRMRVRDIASKRAEDTVIATILGVKKNDLKLESERVVEIIRNNIREGKLDNKKIEIEIVDNPSTNNYPMDVPGMPPVSGGAQMGIINLSSIMEKVVGGKNTKKVKVTIAEALNMLKDEESDNLIDQDRVIKIALKAVQDHGIVFIDEIDKITTRHDIRGGEVNREGVQRDLLPLLEGTVVSTKYGTVNTDHILFVASGAFHLSKPSDLLPELQGRLPIRVELLALYQEDMIKILQEPKASLIKQSIALFITERVDLKFKKDALEQIAEISVLVNSEVENIGARRLNTILEKVLEEISFDVSKYRDKTFTVTKKYVKERVADIAKKHDLSRYIL